MRSDRRSGGGGGCCGPRPPSDTCCGGAPGSNKIKLQASTPHDGASGVDPRTTAVFVFDRGIRVLSASFKGPHGDVIFDIVSDEQKVDLRPLDPLSTGHYSAGVIVDGDSGLQTQAAADFDVMETSS